MRSIVKPVAFVCTVVAITYVVALMASHANPSMNTTSVNQSYSENHDLVTYPGQRLLSFSEWSMSSLAADVSNSMNDSENKTNEYGEVLDSISNKAMLVRILRSTDSRCMSIIPPNAVSSSCCFVAFRGTVNSQGGFDDALSAIPVTWSRHPRVVVGDGFMNAYEAVRDETVAKLNTRYSTGMCDPTSTFITGHSLGAAMAHLATADGLADYNSTRNAGVLTFGAPRTFYSSCSDVETNTRPWPKSAINFVRKMFLDRKVFNNVHTILISDIVADLPPLAMKAYYCQPKNVGIFCRPATGYCPPSLKYLPNLDELCNLQPVETMLLKENDPNDSYFLNSLGYTGLHDNGGYIHLINQLRSP